MFGSGVASITWYADSVFYDTDRFVSVVDGVFDVGAVRGLVADRFTDAVVEGIEGVPVDSLPAGTSAEVSDADTEAIRTVVGEVLSSENADAILLPAITALHTELLLAIDDDSTVLSRSETQVVLDLGPLFAAVQAELATDPATASLAAVTLPADAGTFVVADRTTATDFVWSWLAAADSLAVFLVAMTLLALAGAIAVSDRRGWTILAAGGGVAILAVFIIVVILVFRGLAGVLVGDRDIANSVQGTYGTVIWPLIRQEIVVAVLGIVGAVAGVIFRFFWPDPEPMYATPQPYGYDAYGYPLGPPGYPGANPAPGYGAPGYGTPGYGQPAYRQPAYGQPGYPPTGGVPTWPTGGQPPTGRPDQRAIEAQSWEEADPRWADDDSWDDDVYTEPAPSGQSPVVQWQGWDDATAEDTATQIARSAGSDSTSGSTPAVDPLLARPPADDDEA
ncbi:MAG: hypothetical protein RIE08_09480 [Acidimicrobiales bacterium]